MDKKKFQKRFVDQIQGSDFLEKFFNSFPDTHIFIKDLKGRHVMVNELLSDRDKFKSTMDFVGTTAYDFVSKEWADKYKADDERVFKTGMPIINREEKVKTGKGMKWFLTTKIPLFNEKQKIIGLVGVTKNIENYRALVRKIERQNKQLEKISKLDSLTGCYNQRYLQDELINKIEALSRMKSHNLSILSFDLDDFKIINDTYGHIVGDKVLIRFAKEVRIVIKRKTDCLIRQGGDEFMLALFGTKISDAKGIAKKIQNQIKNIKWPRSYFKGDDKILTTSIGIASLFKGKSLEELMHDADQALYSAKQKGKNRIELN